MNKKTLTPFEKTFIRNLQICILILANTPGEHLLREAFREIEITLNPFDLDQIVSINESPEWKKIKKILKID